MSKNNEKNNSNRTILTDEERCDGIKTDGERCTRKHSPNSRFCKSHLKKSEKPENNEKTAKKRGRKPTTIADPKLFEPETYIPVIYTVINGEKLLIDFNNRVYTNNLENPRYLGIKTVDGIIRD
jgi:hypothetical protein